MSPQPLSREEAIATVTTVLDENRSASTGVIAAQIVSALSFQPRSLQRVIDDLADIDMQTLREVLELRPDLRRRFKSAWDRVGEPTP